VEVALGVSTSGKQEGASMRWTVVSLCVAAGLWALPATAAAQGGTIEGTVQANPPRFLPETFVYLKQVEGSFSPKTVRIDQKGLRFDPHLVTATVGDHAHFENHDSVYHNVFSRDQGGYNVGTFGPNQSGDHVFDKPGVYAQQCSIHPEMLAYVFVGQNPFSTTVDKAGKYRLENVPEGSFQIAVWNPQLKTDEQSVTVSSGKSSTVNFLLKR
jgi:plastocyanin